MFPILLRQFALRARVLAENPRTELLPVIFFKLVGEIPNEIIHKTVSNYK